MVGVVGITIAMYEPRLQFEGCVYKSSFLIIERAPGETVSQKNDIIKISGDWLNARRGMERQITNDVRHSSRKGKALIALELNSAR